jgi:hypothetical protein
MSKSRTEKSSRRCRNNSQAVVCGPAAPPRQDAGRPAIAPGELPEFPEPFRNLWN